MIVLTHRNGSVIPTGARGRLRAGAGSSTAADSVTAGRHAARAAVAHLDGASPALVIVFASVKYDLPRMLAGVREETGAAPLVGATTNGHFHSGELTLPGTGVAVLALAGDRYQFGVASVTGIRDDAFAAGRTLARKARAAAGWSPVSRATLLLLVDGLADDQQTLLSGVYRVTGAAVPVVGGAAGDDRHLAETFVFAGGRVLTDAAVAVWIAADRPRPVAYGHGWRSIGLPLLITRVDGPVVHEIAGRPAQEVFDEHFRTDGPLPELVWQMPNGHYSAGAFGLIQPNGSILIRGTFINDEGVIRTFTPLPAYSAVHLVSCQPEDMLRAGRALVGQVLADEEDAAVLLAFSCVARLDILRDQGGAEAAQLQAAAGAVPVFGCYTYGEYARIRGVVGYHNATLALVAL